MSHSFHLNAFFIVSKHMLSTLCGFVACMLGEAKKRKVHTRSELFLLQMLAATAHTSLKRVR